MLRELLTLCFYKEGLRLSSWIKAHPILVTRKKLKLSTYWWFTFVEIAIANALLCCVWHINYYYDSILVHWEKYYLATRRNNMKMAAMIKRYYVNFSTFDRIYVHKRHRMMYDHRAKEEGGLHTAKLNHDELKFNIFLNTSFS